MTQKTEEPDGSRAEKSLRTARKMTISAQCMREASGNCSANIKGERLQEESQAKK